MSPDQLEETLGEMLDDAGLPRWASATHRPEIESLELAWENGFTLHCDLSRDDISPIDEGERRGILGIPLWGDENHDWYTGV